MRSIPKFVPFARICAVVLALPTFWLTSVHAQEAAQPAIHGIAVANMDRSVKPGDDFYEYANGDWIKRTEIPPDRGRIGVFTALSELSDKRTADLIEEMAKGAAQTGSGARKIADLYNSYMDEAAIESRGLTPLDPHLKAIAAIRNKQELARALGESLRADVDALNNTNFHTANLFGLWVAPGFNDSDHYAAYLLQGGLQLPDREYYLADSDRMRDIRSKYQTHVSAMLKLAGFTETDDRAARIVELEHAIAQTHLSLADNEDIHKANNTWKQADFAAKAPGLDWVEYFRGAGLSKQESFIVWQPGAFTGESALVASTVLDTWKDWLAYHLIEAYAGVLPKALADERFAFFGKILSGTPEQRPRWKRGVETVNRLLGDEVGKLYAQRYFPPEAKAQADTMVGNIITAFRQRIESLSWMDASTKAEAQAKLTTLYVGIGYPEAWRDYSAYVVKADDIFGNFWRGGLFDYRRNMLRLGAPVDRKQWSMTPQTVNAVNLPLQNALNFPAAILQPPFFDPQAPAAVNYGAIGSVIGHEISHTFDSEGATFDSKGRVRNWWTPSDLAHFETATAKLAAQYDTYKPFPDLSVNGKQTLAENIADVAGISAAYDGYRNSLAGQAAPMQGGFSGDQQFFIAFAQNWGSKSREASARQQVMTDPHAPSQFRAATVRNIDAWYAAFDVQAGEKLYLAPPDRVRIW
ncbi:MAG TPA: M13 family metallopeptidase [Terriglobales bacterium]|jgi:putative endopeptidase|nr:M13 family metallopeptidase [Terriglobales bacterium]